MDTYSMQEAKAKFSEIIRQLREGKTVTVTYRGKPAAEIRPVKEQFDTPEKVEAWWDELVRRGVIVPSSVPSEPRRPGPGGPRPALWTGSLPSEAPSASNGSRPDAAVPGQARLRGHFCYPGYRVGGGPVGKPWTST